ncbi:MAG: DUF5661 family protein [Gaiella sp.]
MLQLTLIEATELAEQIGVDWTEVPFDAAQFRAGLEIELERTATAGDTAEPRDLACARIVLARLVERPDFYRADRPWGPDGELAAPS